MQICGREAILKCLSSIRKESNFLPKNLNNQQQITIMKKLILIISTFCFLATINAQEEAIFNHYHANPLLINPATAGYDRDHHKIFMNVRNQWAGFTGAPETYSLSYNGPIGSRLGIGALLFTENIASFHGIASNYLTLSAMI